MNEVTNSRAFRRSLIVLGVLVALTLIVLAIRRATRDEVFVRTAHLTTGDIISTVPTNGKVEPVQLFQAHAAAPSQVQQVFVQAGQVVPAGTLLVKLESADASSKLQTAMSSVAAAKAAQHDLQQGGSQEERIAITGDLNRAQLQSDQAQKDLNALQQLQAKGAASASEVAAARERLLTAQSSLAALQQRSTNRYAVTDRQRVTAQLSDSQAGLAAANEALANSNVRTPIAGTVFSLPVRRFDYVAAGEELVQVADLSRMQIRSYFDEPEIGKLRVGDDVTITWDAKPGRVWHGHIVRTPTTVITYGTRNVGECLIAVDDATGDLLPNTNVTTRVQTQQVRNVAIIPREALRTLGTQNFVYVLKNGILRKTPVQVGALNLQYAQITGGITSADVIALNATSNVDLADGLQVQEAH